MNPLFIVVIILALFLLGLLAICLFHFSKLALDKNIEEKNPFHRAYMLFFLSAVVAEMILFILMVSSPEKYRFFYWNNPDVVIIYLIVLICRVFGLAAVVFVVEKRVFKKEKIIIAPLFFLLLVIGQILLTLAPDVSMGDFIPGFGFGLPLGSLISFIGVALTFFIPIGYIVIGIKSTGIVRRKALIIGISFIVSMIAMMIQGPIILDSAGLGRIIDPHIIIIITIIMRIFSIYGIFSGFK